jgi:hypothetical protein
MFDRYNTVDEKEKMKAVKNMDNMVNKKRPKSASVDHTVDQDTKKGLK